MWDIMERDEPDYGRGALSLVAGVAGGLAVGMLLSRRAPEMPMRRARQLGGELRERAGSLAARLRPGRLRRAVEEQTEFREMEDAVLDTFLADEVLGERGIDVGGISRGIIELSGSVWTEEEAGRAVRLARDIPGVETVVNRLDVEDDGRRHGRWPLADDEAARRETRWTGLRSGMGRRRQGRETDPDRPDDSQHQREAALEDADRDQFEWEGYAARPKMGERPEDDRGRGPRGYEEDELDNEEPVGPHTYGGVARPPVGSQYNTAARVGEGPKPGTELRLEEADLPVKPHGDAPQAGGGEGEGGQHN